MAAVTIKDVAKRAGVSTATVSRVLNDSGYYDKETARLVNSAVESLGYRRNVHWKRLALNSSETICFLLGNRESLNSMQVNMLMASQQVFARAGYDVVFTSFHYAPETPSARLELPRLIAHQGTVDGVVLAGLHYENLVEAVTNIKLPYVMLGNTYIGSKEKLRHDALIYDDVAGAYEATKYLLRLGHKHIAFVGNIELPWFARRYEGYSRAIAESKIKPLSSIAAWDVGDIEYGGLATEELLRRSVPPTAIFGANDNVAGGAWKVLVNRGIRIPHEMSLMGFGDRQEFSILEPSLTTVNVFQDKIGAELASMLLAKLQHQGTSTESRTFPCRLIERNSCSSPAAKLRIAGKS